MHRIPVLSAALLLSTVTLAVLLSGCDTASDRPVVEQTAPADSETDTPAPEVSIASIDADGLAGLVQQYSGKVVLLDFWATWCLSCTELFPHTVDLNARFAGRGLAVISVSLDHPDDRAAALGFLKQQDATFDNFIAAYDNPLDATEAFGIENDTLPNLKLYDRAGKLQKTFLYGLDTSFEPEDIDAAVEKLLGQPQAKD